MKNITIKGIEFEYEVFYHSSEYGESCWTEFYKDIITRKKFFFFGPLINIPKLQFKLHGYDIENPRYTKEIMRKLIEDLYDQEYCQSYRMDEINKGEII